MAWTALTFSYGSVLTSAKMTQMFDNLAAMAAADLGAPLVRGKIVQVTTITATNATWTPNANTSKIVVLCVGGGGAGGGVGTYSGTSYYGEGGQAGTHNWGYIASVSGTYAATIGTGGAGVSNGIGNTGGTTSFGAAASAVGGVGGNANTETSSKLSARGETNMGAGGVPAFGTGGSAAANSAAGGGGAINGLINTGPYAGGAGGSGVIIVWEFA